MTASAGINHRQWDEGPAVPLAEVNHMTGGAAAADYDGDGWVDLFVTRMDASDLLYRNRGDGTFEDVSAAAGFQDVLPTNGATWADLDNDGDQDLYVTAVRSLRNYVYLNNGRGGFEERGLALGAAASTAEPTSRYGVAAGDYDRDGRLDLYTTQWGRSPSAPGSVPPNASRLLRNTGTGFTDLTGPAGVEVGGINPVGRPTYGFAPRFTDLDADGVTDLVVASDFGRSRLFWGNGDGTFADGTAGAGVGTDENGMGSTVADYDGDGRLDWFVTSIYDADGGCRQPGCNWGGTGNRLYRNLGSRTFSDATDEAGVREGGWGWGASFADFDNDGLQDLVMTNGIRFPGTDLADKYADDPIRLWRNIGDGAFSEIGLQAGLADTGSGKGLLTFDYDRDGDLDLFVVNNADAPILYRNDTETDAVWLQIETVGTVSNRDGIGALVTVVADGTQPDAVQVREIDGGSNFLAHNERIAHFGLGTGSESVDRVTIGWPSGTVQTLRNVPTNQRLRVIEAVPEPCSFLASVAAVLVHALRRRSCR